MFRGNEKERLEEHKRKDIITRERRLDDQKNSNV